MSTLRVDSVTKTFDGRVLALDELSLQVRSARRLALLGPSGSGKSTLLRVMAGLERASSGTVSLDGHRLDAQRPHERQMGLVLQSNNLLPHWTVAENLALRSRLQGDSVARQRAIADEVAQRLGLTAWLDRYPGELSGGQSQWVAIGRLIADSPRWWLMDEPMAQIDPQHRHWLRERILEGVEAASATLIYVTHDQDEAFAMGEDLALLFDGKIEQHAEVERVYRHPTTRRVAEFLGNPPMLLNRVLRIEDSLSLGATTASILRPQTATELAQNLVWGVRPEDLALGPGELTWEARVERIEFRGSLRAARLQTNGGPLWCLLPPQASPRKVGEVLHIGTSTSDIRWFDADSGLAVNSPFAPVADDRRLSEESFAGE